MDALMDTVDMQQAQRQQLCCCCYPTLAAHLHKTQMGDSSRHFPSSEPHLNSGSSAQLLAEVVPGHIPSGQPESRDSRGARAARAPLLPFL